jgi:hypothetical protein
MRRRLKMSDRLQRHKYWNANGFAVAIVCKEGGNHDYSAYIGSTEGIVSRESTTVEFVLGHGCKLDKDLTNFLFPEFKEAGLTWRP